MLRARAEARPADSISHFRRHLNVLQRTGPTAVRPANTLGMPGYAAAAHPPSRGFAPSAPAGRRWPHSSEAARRARTLRRRRDVLFTLLAGMAGTLLLGFLPSLRVLWSLHLVLDLLFGAYVALLVRARRLAVERDVKLRFLPANVHADNVILFRRSAN